MLKSVSKLLKINQAVMYRYNIKLPSHRLAQTPRMLLLHQPLMGVGSISSKADSTGRKSFFFEELEGYVHFTCKYGTYLQVISQFHP